MAPDFLHLGAKWPLESKCYFEACYYTKYPPPPFVFKKAELRLPLNVVNKTCSKLQNNNF